MKTITLPSGDKINEVYTMWIVGQSVYETGMGQTLNHTYRLYDNGDVIHQQWTKVMALLWIQPSNDRFNSPRKCKKGCKN